MAVQVCFIKAVLDVYKRQIRGREEEYQILVEKEFGDSNLQSKLEGK